jgi:iron complex transport system ATP-binding protein
VSLSADSVSVRFGQRTALSEASLTAGHGTVTGLIGPNGSGKTTLLRTLYRSLRPDAGTVRLDGRPIDEIRPRQVAQQVAVVVQEPPSEITLTVAEMVLLGRAPHRTMWEPYTVDDHRTAARLLSLVGLRDRADDPYPDLSGGERQRVLLARALAQGAQHLLLDEPTNHLDIRYQHEILALVRTLPASIIVVLHDLNLAARYCDRLVLLDKGCVVADGPPRAILEPALIEQVYGVVTQRIDQHDGTPQMVFGGTAIPSTTHQPDRSCNVVHVDDVAEAASIWCQVFGHRVVGLDGPEEMTVADASGRTTTFRTAPNPTGLRYLGFRADDLDAIGTTIVGVDRPSDVL